MSRKLEKDLWTFFRNLGKHAKRVLTLRESPLAAFRGIAGDLHKLRHGVSVARRSGDEREARRMLEKGRKAYNEKRYTEAQGYFLRALEFDEHLAWAYCFLGHTAYQLGHADEAVTHWHRAVMTDPHSDAAAKARQKIEGLGAKRREVLDELEQHLRDSSQTPIDL